MKKLLFIWLLCTYLQKSDAQLFSTRNGYIGFFSQTPLENVRAENRQVYAIIDADKKSLAFISLLKGFLFQKELMQEHFNENYIESDKYPKATFTGSYTGDVDAKKEGTYPVEINGQLTLHGITKNIQVPGTIEVQQGKLIGKSNFELTPSDFNISIPAIVREKIAKQIDVHVQVECTPK